MKSVFATVALATAVAAAPKVPVFTPGSADVPATNPPTACANMVMTSVPATGDAIFRYMKVGTGTEDPQDVQACVNAINGTTTPKLIVALTDKDAAYACASDATPPTVLDGANASCPAAADGVCTTVLNTCVVGFTCVGAVAAEGTTPAVNGACRVQLYTDAAVFPTQVPTDCANLKLAGEKAAGATKPLFQTIVKADGNPATAAQITKCAGTTAAGVSLPKVTAAETLQCAQYATTSPFAPTINAGVNASCPLEDKKSCTQTQVCMADSKCKGVTDKTAGVCTAIDFTTVQIKTDSALAFTVAATDAASAQVTKAQTDAMAIVMKDCKAPTGVATWIAKKDAKQLVNVVKGDKDCLVAANVKKELEAAYKTSSDVKDANKITVASVDQKDLSTWAKCLVEGKYVCAGQAKDCTAIKCNLAKACTKNDDCGTDNCTTTKGADGKEVKQCAVSGSALASTMMAVGAAVVAAMLF